MWYLVLALLGLLYLALNTVIPAQGTLGTYILQPILWIGLALFTLLLARNEGTNILRFKRIPRWYLGNSPLQAGLLLGGFQVSLLIIIGLFTGFGKSPYSFAPLALAINILYVASFLIGTEITRAYLIKQGAKTRKHTTLVLTLTTLLYVAIQLSPSQLLYISSGATVVILEFLGKTIITAIAMNLLASYLAYMGGATASLGYMGIIMSFTWFSPILPNPHWTICALIGTITPAIGYTLIQNSIKEPGITHHRKARHTSVDSYGWTIVAIFCVLIVFFSFGFLGVKPTVVYSGSMQPSIQVGDLALIQQTDPASIKEGDVIQFHKDNMTLLHRIIHITDQEGQTLYTTKGDANKDPDTPPITQAQILGKSICTIPKVGWIQIFIKGMLKQAGIQG